MNDLIRASLGRTIEPAPELERPAGDILGRRKPGPAAFPRKPMTNALVNERIRAGARIVRSVQLRDGLNLDLDDPWR
jgi:hypothetical protein